MNSSSRMHKKWNISFYDIKRNTIKRSLKVTFFLGAVDGYISIHPHFLWLFIIIVFTSRKKNVNIYVFVFFSLFTYPIWGEVKKDIDFLLIINFASHLLCFFFYHIAFWPMQCHYFFDTVILTLIFRTDILTLVLCTKSWLVKFLILI